LFSAHKHEPFSTYTIQLTSIRHTAPRTP